MEVTLIDHMGTDLTVVNSARVSFAKKQEYFNLEKDTKLISYLAKHKHTSPFGHCFASFHVCAPIFVARQLVKHKFLRWNEVSRRYVDDEPTFFKPRSLRTRPVDKKQGSGGEMNGMQSEAAFDIVSDAIKFTNHWYQDLIELGVAPEQARMILPQNMNTEWYWSGSLDAFADMCNLRCKPDAQEETKVIGDLIDKEMLKLFPVSWEALRNEH